MGHALVGGQSRAVCADGAQLHVHLQVRPLLISVSWVFHTPVPVVCMHMCMSVFVSARGPRHLATRKRARVFVFSGRPPLSHFQLLRRDVDPEEPIKSSGYICDFDDLQVRAVNLDDVMLVRPSLNVCLCVQLYIYIYMCVCDRERDRERESALTHTITCRTRRTRPRRACWTCRSSPCATHWTSWRRCVCVCVCV